MRGSKVKTRTVDGSEVTETIYFDADALRANGPHAAQLGWMVKRSVWGDDVQKVEDVFNSKIVDDGACLVVEFAIEEVTYSYWLARFGGNVKGSFLRPWLFDIPGNNTWDIVAQNVDDVIQWCGPGAGVPEGFLERLRAIIEKESVLRCRGDWRPGSKGPKRGSLHEYVVLTLNAK